MTDLDTTNTDIREAPEGMVFTEDIVDALRAVAFKSHWCGADRRYLTAHTGIMFDRGVDPYTVALDSPEVISVKSVKKVMLAAIRDNPYVVKAVMEIASLLGIELVIPNDKFVITVELSTFDIQAQRGSFDPDAEDFDLSDWVGTVVCAIEAKLSDRDGWCTMNVPGVAVRRIPDPARLTADGKA